MQVRGFLLALAGAALVPLAAPLAAPLVTPIAVPFSASIAAQSAPRVATTFSPGELAELERVRRQVWLDWFAGDTASLRRVLGPELVAVGPDSPHWQSLGETLAASAWFKESGGRLLEITFDSTVVHRLGDVAVMFSHYAMRTSRSGAVAARQGKVTEVFVRQRGRWVHTSWHIDNAVSSTGE
jgi:ketosteroid isomerase-like protein